MSMIKDKNIINLFQNSVLAQGLDRKKIEEFLKSSKVDYKKYHEGEFIFHEGDVPRKLYMLIEGQIKIAKDTYLGRQLALGEITRPGDIFGEVYLFLGHKAYDMYTMALEDSSILEISSSLTEAFEYQKKCQELIEWKKAFKADSQRKKANLRKRLQRKLARGIREFAEDNYDNEDAGEDWKEYLQEELKLEADCMSFLQERSNKCSRKRREMMDSLRTELTFAGVNAEFDDISMDSITDTQLLGTIAGGALTIICPVAGIAVTLINWLFGSSKEEKIREAKAKLRDALQDAMDECGYVDTLMDSVAKTMSEEIFGKGVDGLYNALAKMDAMLIGLAKEEAAGAEKLGVLLNQLNCQLLHEAEGYVAAQEGTNLVSSVKRIARIPGEVTVVYDTVDSFDGYEAQMTKLIGEKVELRILDNAGNFYGEMVKKTEELIGSFGIEQVGAFAKVFNEEEVTVIQPTERKLTEIKMNDRYRLVYQYMGMPMVQ